MKKVFLAMSLMCALTLTTSCSNDSMETVSTEKFLKPTTASAAREGEDNPYGEDIYDIKIVSTDEVPLKDFETEGVDRSLGFKCKVTDHFAGAYTNNHYYHVNCGGTHYVVTYYGFSNTWVSHLETEYDSTIWHGGK